MSRGELPPGWRVRPWQAADLEDVYAIASHPEIRRHFFQTEPFPFSEHTSWFHRALAERRPYFVLEGPGGVAGYVRLDDGEVSIALAPASRGRGLALAALTATLRRVDTTSLPVRAYVKPENTPSLSLFRKAGFDEIGTTCVEGYETVMFEYMAAPDRWRSVARLALGTVQIGMPYGRRREKAQMEETDAAAILDTAWRHGIREYDTATAYGVAIDRLSGWLYTEGLMDEARITTKVPTGSDMSEVPLRAAVAPFGDARSITVLSHGFANPGQWESFRVAVDKVEGRPGQSVYDEAEVREAVQAPGIARVQAPANVLDQRALQERGDIDTPLQLRSIFLQGVLLEEPVTSRAGAGLREAVEGLRAAARAAQQSLDTLLVASMLRQIRAGDQLVVGVDHPAHVDRLMLALDVPNEALDRFDAWVARRVQMPDTATLDPRNWDKSDR